jgi:CheY-specific phosphatase CheX
VSELVIDRGYLTRRQAAEVSAEQRNRDLAFGDLAVELGFLESEQLVDVVAQQRSQHIPFGQAIVRLGYLANDRLGTLLDAYKADQAQYEISEIDLPDGLASHRAAQFVLDLLPRFLMRVARLQVKVGEMNPLETVPDFAEIRVSVPLHGMHGVEVVLISDIEFAEALAMASSGLAPEDLDPEMVADGVGEFLNVLAGNASSALNQEGHLIELGPPDYDAELGDGWLVDLAVGTGRAAMVLRTF